MVQSAELSGCHGDLCSKLPIIIIELNGHRLPRGLRLLAAVKDRERTTHCHPHKQLYQPSLSLSVVVLQADKKRNRAKLIEFFADTAMECKKLNNYNSFMAISGKPISPPPSRPPTPVPAAPYVRSHTRAFKFCRKFSLSCKINKPPAKALVDSPSLFSTLAFSKHTSQR